LVQGIPIEKDQIPVLHTDCDFGRWYYNEGQVLMVFKEFKEIEEVHMALHRAYAQVFKLITEEENASMFSKLLGIAKRHHEKNEPIIKQKMMELEEASRAMIRRLDALEAKLLAMSDEEFAKKIGHLTAV
ncbi:MAG TPA: hypothetical protein ENN02_02770, partial [Halothiobacillus sp.]|nr:hypothetical protein [Halothiobacillus sp.]